MKRLQFCFPLDFLMHHQFLIDAIKVLFDGEHNIFWFFTSNSVLIVIMFYETISSVSVNIGACPVRSSWSFSYIW